MRFHFYEVVNGPDSEALVASIAAFAENLDAWIKVTREIGFTLVVVELKTEAESLMFDLAFGQCDKY